MFLNYPAVRSIKHYFCRTGTSALSLMVSIRIMGFAKVKSPPRHKEKVKNKLEEPEGYWKIQLNTLKLFGINIIDEFASSTGRKGIMMELL